VDAQTTEEYDAIGRGPIFSADGKHVAYSVKNANKWSVVVDGKVGEDYGGTGPLVFNPDGTLEYVAVKDNTLYRIKYAPK
jgi:hypothetical protein